MTVQTGPLVELQVGATVWWASCDFNTQDLVVGGIAKAGTATVFAFERRDAPGCMVAQ